MPRSFIHKMHETNALDLEEQVGNHR